MALKINHIIFDKTGTLTKGTPFVVDYLTNNPLFILKVSASLEKKAASNCKCFIKRS